MNIKSIDLWTEQHDNHYELFNGAFIDGIDKKELPYDRYKIVYNCNCIITVDKDDIKIKNKHHAIIFYKNNVPSRLVVLNKNTDIQKCINVALDQHFSNTTVGEFFKTHKINGSSIDLKEDPIYKESDSVSEETDIGSCDRWNLLYNMLKGSYTESSTNYGNYENDRYEFMPNINIKYYLKTLEETFEIEHKCAFINTIKTRLIPIQENSPLTKSNN